ncbi:hypothetical protein SAY87_031798 [Trapa incisa]|uniref:Uncharacterized protein n=1 Tax=Trapa incisa TaxID=236973 RepID=A0AAN7KQ18_9MYRT|nr:hypothetical protein SAY87_031798 [Trapa incisa]
MASHGQRQRWRINVHAKSRVFSLRVRATGTGTATATSIPHDLTALLRLRGFFLKLGSVSSLSNPRSGGGILKSMFRRLFKRNRNHRPPPTPPTERAAPYAALASSVNRLKQLAHEDTVGILSIFLAIFILGAVAAISVQGALDGGAFFPMSLMLTPSSLLLLLLKKLAKGRNLNNMPLTLWKLLVATLIILGCASCEAGKYLNFSKNYVMRYLWEVLKLAI